MSDQLRDLLSRVADDAPAPRPDPTLWRRARRARTRNRALAVGAVAATVAVIATVAVQGQRLSSDPDPAPNPPEHRLTSVHGVVGDGGLRLERDLAVGQATAVVTNDSNTWCCSCCSTQLLEGSTRPRRPPERVRATARSMNS